MSEDYGVSNDGGFLLSHMVQAQRGLSDREIEIFLATGRKPDLSQPPPEDLEIIDGDTQVMPLDDAAAWLSGGALTASSFFDFDPSHSVSPLYEVMRPKVESFKFNKNQPRDEDGQWTDGFPGVNPPDLASKPSGIKTGGSAKSTKNVTPAVIYKKHDDGAVVGHSGSGQRMRWDAGRKKFVVETEKNDSWVEESAHTKTSAYNEFKNPDKWFEPSQTGTENEPSSPSLTPEPDLADTDTTAETALPPQADIEMPDAAPPAEVAKSTKMGMSEDDAQKFISDWGANVDLSDDDRQAIKDWATPDMSAMRGMQTHLHEDSELTADEITLRDKLDDVAARGKLTESVKTYRVVKPWADIDGDSTGKTITDRGFQSTSLAPDDVISMWGGVYAASGDNPVIFEMNVPAGTPAFTPEWNKSTFAHELTLGRDVDMKITGTRDETMFVPGLGKEHTFKVLTMDVTSRAKTASLETSKQAGYPAPEPVPEVDPDWPFSFEPFQEPQMDYGHLVRSSDDAYKNDPNHNYELKTLPVNTIVPSQENDYEEWGDGLENDMTGKPLAIKKDGNLYLMDGHHRTAKAGEGGSIQAWVLDLDKPKAPQTSPEPAGQEYWDEHKDKYAAVKLTEAERGALDAYTMNGFGTMNKIARGDKDAISAADAEGELDEWDGIILGLNSVIHKMPPLQDDITVYRGVDGAHVPESGEWTEKGFTSTSWDKSFANNWANDEANSTVVELRLHKGAPALVTTPEVEAEVILPLDTKFRVVSSEMIDGKRHVIAELASAPTPAKIDAPEIPKQADAPEIESTPTTPYVGPTATNYEGASKVATDALRQAYVVEIAHERRVDARAAELRDTDKETYTGWDAINKSMEVARAELAGDAPSEHELADALEMLDSALPDYTSYEKVRRRLNYEASLEVSFSTFAKEQGLGELTPEVKADLAKQTKDAFAGKKIAVRVSAKTVEHILGTGRIKSQFETNKSSGKKDTDMRASVETTLFGIDDKPWQNAEKRPIYGYVALDGIRPAGIGSAELSSPSTDQLTQYGNVQVVLKDSVRSRTTAMFGDSLNEMREGTPSPIDDPDYKSFTAGRGALTSRSLDSLDRSGETSTFRAGSYAEAQIHGGVGVDDIEEIVFSSNPTATVKQQLEDAGIPYRVLNFKTAADGSDDDRANALRIAEQDKPLIEGEIANLQAKLADPKYAGDEFYKKDLAKYEKHLKTINDALPALRGEKTSSTKKVAAAKEKVAKATAPKQAEAPKIESASALGADFADISSRLDKIFTANEYYGRKFKELFEKQYQKASGVLNSADQWTLDNADKNLTQAWKDARPDVSKAIDLLVKRAQAVGGNDANDDYWSQRSDAKVNIRPKVNKDTVDKIAERYVSKDLVTITHNAALRSGSPDAAALKWTKSMDRMTDSGEIPEDTRVYRGAAFSPEFAASLTPGSVMLDNAFMSAGFDDKTAKHYAGERQRTRPGHIPTIFEIRVPGGTRAYEVENDELVFGRGKALRIVSVQKQDDDYMRVIVDMLTLEQAEELANG